MFTVRGVDDRLTTNFSNLFSVAVESPAADLSPPDDVFDELDPLAKPHRQLVKELYVLQEVVV